MSLYVRDLKVCGFWYLWGFCNQSNVYTEGRFVQHNFLHEILEGENLKGCKKTFWGDRSSRPYCVGVIEAHVFVKMYQTLDLNCAYFKELAKASR
jgi:hypothetical protein